jgi:hypothetical protein
MAPALYRIIRTSAYVFEAEAVETATPLVDEEVAYRIGFGYAMAATQEVHDSRTHEEMCLYEDVLYPLPRTPDEFRRAFGALNRIFQSFRRPVFYVLRP